MMRMPGLISTAATASATDFASGVMVILIATQFHIVQTNICANFTPSRANGDERSAILQVDRFQVHSHFHVMALPHSKI